MQAEAAPHVCQFDLCLLVRSVSVFEGDVHLPPEGSFHDVSRR